MGVRSIIKSLDNFHRRLFHVIKRLWTPSYDSNETIDEETRLADTSIHEKTAYILNGKRGRDGEDGEINELEGEDEEVSSVVTLNKRQRTTGGAMRYNNETIPTNNTRGALKKRRNNDGIRMGDKRDDAIFSKSQRVRNKRRSITPVTPPMSEEEVSSPALISQESNGDDSTIGGMYFHI